jgi:transposase
VGEFQLTVRVLAATAPYQWAHRLLQTIPGIDQIASALILIEIGDDMTRFGSADRLAAWAALCPGNNESAGKRKSARIGKGSSVIRYIMCECANSAWKTKSSLAAKYRSLMVRNTHKTAIIALAHKMIRLIFLLLTRKVAYHDPQIDYEAISAKKNAPRWIKQLKVIGQWPNNASTSATT